MSQSKREPSLWEHPEPMPIPTDWTADQAETVYVFLLEVANAVWDIHGDQIMRLLRERTERRDHETDDVNDLPF